MKRMFAISILALFVASAGCVAGSDDPSSDSIETAAAPADLAPANVADGPSLTSTPGASDLALSLTRDVRLAGDTSCTDTEVTGEVGGKHTAEITVIVHCNRKCIMGCGDLRDDACAYSCCEVH